MDIQGASTAASQTAFAAGNTGASESLAEERKAAEDSNVERKEAEPSSTGPNVGQNVDIQA